MKFLYGPFLVISGIIALPCRAEEVRFRAEVGTIGVLNHDIRFGQDGTQFDYVKEGAQDVLFPFYRFDVDWVTGRGDTWRFLYQPLVFATAVRLDRDVTLDGLTLNKDEPVDLLYSFPFYRASYIQAIQLDEWRAGFGAGLQIRDARIVFTTADGKKRHVSQNIGPVPLVVAGAEREVNGLQVGAEISTIYAPVKYLNGSDSDVVGAFTDASVSMGKSFAVASSLHLIARYLGGGASGTSTKGKGRGDGYSSNWIDLVSLSIGVERSY